MLSGSKLGSISGRTVGGMSPRRGKSGLEDVHGCQGEFPGGFAGGYWLRHRNTQTDEQTYRQLLAGHSLLLAQSAELKQAQKIKR